MTARSSLIAALRRLVHLRLGGMFCRHHWDLIAHGPGGGSFECVKCGLTYDSATGWSR